MEPSSSSSKQVASISDLEGISQVFRSESEGIQYLRNFRVLLSTMVYGNFYKSMSLYPRNINFRRNNINCRKSKYSEKCIL